jgi:hypothetical protein
MFSPKLPRTLLANPTRILLFLVLYATVPGSLALAQTDSTLQGRITDPDGAAVPEAIITATSTEIAVARSAQSDAEGIYQVSALPAGYYRVEVQARGFQRMVINNMPVNLGRLLIRDFQLSVGDVSHEVTVSSEGLEIERTTVSLGHIVNRRAVQNLPLNGRYFLDVALLVPGSVTNATSGFSTTPSRGVGAMAINTAGNREETTNYLINGITLTNQAFNAISFQPSISTISEFKIDNSTFSAEFGQNSGAIVKISTRSGTNQFHGELFEFLRNDAFDARNFFSFTSTEPPPFKRNQFGGNLAGPIIKNRLFFFASYEGLRQHQEVPLNSLVLSDAERVSISDPLIRRLVEFVPRANFVDSSGTSRFVGSTNAPVSTDQWALDLDYAIAEGDRLHGYYHMQRIGLVEPNRSGNSIPGFGHTFSVQRHILTLNETHIFNPKVVNEARLGFTRNFGTAIPNVKLNPESLGIRNGVNQPIGLPQINIAGGLNFGGPANQPVGRGDTTVVLANTLSYLRGKHFFKFGGEGRQFYSGNFSLDTGRFNFASIPDFINGNANFFSITVGDRSSNIKQSALNLFAQDHFKWRRNLSLDLGVRYEWNMTPTERFDRFIVFDPGSVSLRRVGVDVEQIYRQNNKNFEPRVGFSWDPFGDGRTVVRAAYAILTDQPMTSLVAPTTANPPRATPLTFSGPVSFDNAIKIASEVGLAPTSIDHNFRNSYLQSWNLNVQRELMPGVVMMAGYVGSKGTHLVLRRNLNQPDEGVRPFPFLSASSPILPGAPLGNITQVESTGNSSYSALWTSINQQLKNGLQLSAHYTWSKSIDYNSLSSQGVVVQDSYNLRNDRGLSDFDVRHRFVVNAIYDLPLRGNRFVEGWQLATIVQLQTGNPVNIITSNATLNGVANTIRPDITGPVTILGNVERWFDTSVFISQPRFGNLGRNLITGPGFSNTDFSIIKNTSIGERFRLQFRAEFFDLFNHANFGQPGNVVGSANFGRITSTRFPTGESGSSRQVQFALKASF